MRSDWWHIEATPMKPSQFFSLEELAELSDESLGVWRKRILHRKIAYSKFGRNVRVALEDFEAFVRARRVPARSMDDAQ